MLTNLSLNSSMRTYSMGLSINNIHIYRRLQVFLFFILLLFGSMELHAASYTWSDGKRTYKLEELPSMKAEFTSSGIKILDYADKADSNNPQQVPDGQRSPPIFPNDRKDWSHRSGSNYDADTKVTSKLSKPNSNNPQATQRAQESSAVSSSANSSPVFRDSSGGLRALPGGVLIIFHKHISQQDLLRFWQDRGISQNRISRVEAIDNLYKVQTSAGMESLQLSNSLAQYPEVEYVSPNWWREVVTK
ncbi:MAG: hypothetical protein HAW61_04560 [Candidatus Portiera sp.]|nr:hypothetical protein [Portiera sp.]